MRIYRSSRTVISRRSSKPTGVQEEKRRLIGSNSDTVQGGRDPTASQTGLAAREHGEDHRESVGIMDNAQCVVWRARISSSLAVWKFIRDGHSCAVGQSRSVKPLGRLESSDHGSSPVAQSRLTTTISSPRSTWTVQRMNHRLFFIIIILPFLFPVWLFPTNIKDMKWIANNS